MNNRCNFTSCRFNADGTCENEEAREECVDMSRKVLCLGESQWRFVLWMQNIVKRVGFTKKTR